MNGDFLDRLKNKFDDKKSKNLYFVDFLKINISTFWKSIWIDFCFNAFNNELLLNKETYKTTCFIRLITLVLIIVRREDLFNIKAINI